MPITSPPVSDIVDGLTALTGTAVGPTRISGADPITPSPHRIGDASAAAIAAFGAQIAALGDSSVVSVSVADAVDQLRAAYLTTINGQPTRLIAEDPTALRNNDFYRTADGWTFLITTFPHQRDAVCAVLDCPPTKERIAQAALTWNSVALEEAVVAAGGVAAAARTAQQWAGSPVGIDVARRPVIDLERIDDAEPESLTAPREWPPLTGVRVVDMTHVIAGPVSTELLATFGADVVHVTRPDLVDPHPMPALTGGGKRNAYCDVRDPDQLAALTGLIADADVFVNAYRGLQRHGLDAEHLAQRRPGIIVVEYHCWGSDGPWGDRGGFDQLACSATGFSLEEGLGGPPKLPPTHLLNDYLAAYLGATGIVAALRRRQSEGGSWRVRINLARVCTWVHSLGLSGAAPDTDWGTRSIDLTTVDGPFGRIDEPVIPIFFDGKPTPHPLPARPLGTSPLTW
nr:CoA transferase [Gordonia aichiensis]